MKDFLVAAACEWSLNVHVTIIQTNEILMSGLGPDSVLVVSCDDCVELYDIMTSRTRKLDHIIMVDIMASFEDIQSRVLCHKVGKE